MTVDPLLDGCLRDVQLDLHGCQKHQDVLHFVVGGDVRI